MTMTYPNPTFKRGDVVLVLFPHSDLLTAKLRPALVVQADDLLTGLPQVIVAMITSNLSRSNHPCRVSIFLSSPEGPKSGLLTDSVVMADNLAAITFLAIDRAIGRLPMKKVDEALRYTLAIYIPGQPVRASILPGRIMGEKISAG